MRKVRSCGGAIAQAIALQCRYEPAKRSAQTLTACSCSSAVRNSGGLPWMKSKDPASLPVARREKSDTKSCNGPENYNADGGAQAVDRDRHAAPDCE